MNVMGRQVAEHDISCCGCVAVHPVPTLLLLPQLFLGNVNATLRSRAPLNFMSKLKLHYAGLLSWLPRVEKGEVWFFHAVPP